MPQMLTTLAKVQCPHMGLGTSTSLTPIMAVGAGTVLAEGDTGVLACPNLPYPCIGYTLRSMGLNASAIAGRRVILETDFNQTLTGLPLSITEFHNQAIDQSTPAPLPAGGAAPPPTPAMADVVKPVVSCLPAALAFSKTTSLPPFVTTTFTLSSAFPMKWILTLLKQPTGMPGGHEDLTPGQSPNITVVPAGGAWTTPSLTVTLTVTAAYMSALPPGDYDFYLTGISQRGLNAWARARLVVSP